MELLKKSVLTAALFALMQPLWAQQNYDKIIEAFKTSYEQEKSGDYAKAVEALQAVYDDNSYEINLRLGWLKYSAGLFSEAVPYYRKCIELKPLSIEARLGLVNPAAAMGNWSQVETQYKKILDIDPNNSLVNYRLGLIYYGREQYETAMKYFNKVLNHYPFDYNTIIMMAWTNYKLGKNREAEVLFNKALLYNPDDTSAKEGLELINK